MFRKSLKNLVLNISIAVTVILLFLAVFEIILSQKFTKGNEVDQLFKEKFVEGDTPYKPNAYVVFEGGFGLPRLDPTVVKINPQGLRDYEYSVEKPANTFRILGLGDSITWGHGVELEDTYLKQLEKKLNSASSGIHYEVINFGVGGYNTQQSVQLLKAKGLAYKPDMVILSISANDAKLAGQIYDISNETKTGAVESPLSNTYIYTWVGTKIHNLKVKKSVSKLESNPYEFWGLIEPSLTELSQMAVENNFTVVSLIAKGIVLREEYENFAYKHNFYETLYILNENLRLQGDPHPNPLGHELIAEKLYKTLISKNLIPSNRE